VTGNTIRCSGRQGTGAVALYTKDATTFGYNNEVTGNSLTLIDSSSGYVANNQKGLRIGNNALNFEWNSAAAVAIIGYGLYNCFSSSIRNNTISCRTGYGANITVYCLYADTNTKLCSLGPINVSNDGSLTLTHFVDGGGNTKILDTGNVVSATTLGTLAKKMTVFNPDGTEAGFIPVYSSIT
jgi:hypothetical protein